MRKMKQETKNKSLIPNDPCPDCGNPLEFDPGNPGDYETPQEDAALHCSCGFDTNEIDWSCFDYETKQFVRITEAQKTRATKVQKALNKYQAEKHKTAPLKIGDMFEHAPEGDFTWEPSEAGDWHVYNCGDSDCPVQWHRIAYALNLKRIKGKRSLEYMSCDSEGDWDCIGGWEEGENDADTEWLLRELANEHYDHFASWTEYNLHCFETGNDVLNDFSSRASTEDFLKAAEDMVKYLK